MIGHFAEVFSITKKENMWEDEKNKKRIDNFKIDLKLILEISIPQVVLKECVKILKETFPKEVADKEMTSIIASLRNKIRKVL